jgi:hypothetical protein
MPLDFPNSPSKGDIFTNVIDLARVWVYTGSKWEITNTGTTQVWTVYNQANVANALPVGNTLSNTFFAVRASRTKFNFIPADSITINVDDDSAGQRVNVTVAGTARAGSALIREPQVYQTINAPSTWSKPAGLAFVIVEVQGGGGGGGGSGLATIATGGGAGGYARRTIAAASLAATETVTVGSGGAGGASGATAGAAGGSSSFGTTPFCTACGGAGGVTGGNGLDATAGGAGGLATSGDINNQGGDGGYAGGGGAAVSGAVGNIYRWGGKGGESFFGGGGFGPVKSATGNIQTGTPGKAFGSGGAGATSNSGSGGGAGGTGKQGIVIVWEFA